MTAPAMFTAEQLLVVVGAAIRAIMALLVVLMGRSEWLRTRREAFRILGWAFSLVVLEQVMQGVAPWAANLPGSPARLVLPVWIHFLEGWFLILLCQSMAVHERSRVKELRRVTSRLFEANLLIAVVIQALWLIKANGEPALIFAHTWGDQFLAIWEILLQLLAAYLAVTLKPEIRVGPALVLLLVSKGATLGNLFIWHGTELWIPLVEWVSAAVAATMLLAAAHFGIVTETFTDPLTRLHNRRYFMSRVAGEFDRARRKGAPISIFVMDLDHFKRYNDTMGHVAGDAMLKAMAQVLHRNLRPYDLLCRWGGEEFVALLPDTDADTSVRVAERLRQLVADAFGKPDRRAPVTISIGVAAWPETEGTWRQLMEAADEALYRAKQWRNRVSVYEGSPRP